MIIYSLKNIEVWFLCISRKQISFEISAKYDFAVVMAISSLWQISKGRWIYFASGFQHGNSGPYAEGN